MAMQMVLLLSGCGSILEQYELARAAALADPGPVPDHWAPDAAILLSPALVDDVVAEATEQAGTLRQKIDAGLVTLEPALAIERLDVRAGGCERCLSLDVRLDGKVGFSTPIVSGSAPLVVDGRLDAELTAERTGDVFTVYVAPRSLAVTTFELGTLKAGIPDVRGTIVDWLSQAILANLEPIALTEVGGAELPMRAVRVVPVGEGVRVDLLTASPVFGAVPRDSAIPAEGFRVELALSSLVALARAEAFRYGPVGHDIVADPTSLDLGPDGFVLGLRLWHVASGAWWRDYTVTGEVRLRDGKLVRFVPTSVTEDAQSRGAAWADPLVALLEGKVIEVIDGAIDQTLPAKHVERIGDVRTRVELQEIDAYEGVLRASGSVGMREVKRKRDGE